ncbi:hypothetical protein PUN28_007767 [Cardiocondyla obscurior]|uniref:Uncharacterized protein n=1 Tax=Cardiocondyla obscurior TaxID=286306 RepID=A0AAW2G0J3_9HYME
MTPAGPGHCTYIGNHKLIAATLRIISRIVRAKPVFLSDSAVPVLSSRTDLVISKSIHESCTQPFISMKCGNGYFIPSNASRLKHIKIEALTKREEPPGRGWFGRPGPLENPSSDFPNPPYLSWSRHRRWQICLQNTLSILLHYFFVLIFKEIITSKPCEKLADVTSILPIRKEKNNFHKREKKNNKTSRHVIVRSLRNALFDRFQARERLYFRLKRKPTPSAGRNQSRMCMQINQPYIPRRQVSQR